MTNPQGSQAESADLLDHLLESLFGDFCYWFERGLVLLDHAPDHLVPPQEQREFRAALQEGLQAIAATQSLRAACSTPMAVDMDAMTPWHRLMMRVWNLSAMLRMAGVPLPEQQRPETPQA